MLPRRRVLAASAAALPVLLVTAGCRSSDAFAGPDPLAGPPSLSPDVITLQQVIAAEQAMITLYRAAVGGAAVGGAAVGGAAVGGAFAGGAAEGGAFAGGAAGGGGPQVGGRARILEGLLGQHRQHLGQLQARLVLPSGLPSASASASASGAAVGRVTIARLRAAERASAADLVRRLVTVPPALAQLFASIAASDATHVTVLGG
jgi:hypothetical protein